jgi:acetoin utilization deacetylase AcuC-like enzyme
VFTTDGDGRDVEQVVVVSHPDCLDHRTPPGHPESAERLEAVLQALSDPPNPNWILDRSHALPASRDIEGVLAWIHDRDHIERVRTAAEGAARWIDGHDNAVSSGTYRAALAASGLTLSATLDLVNRRLRRAFLAIRPPGHHAERDCAKGYCFFNNVALAAEVVVRSWDSTVLVVDIDAFHGNGTQLQFYHRADVGYLSVHRFPAFPGSGTADEVGEGAGRGTTRNVPLVAAADDDMFCTALEHGLEELGGRLRPAAILVSAGFSAHRDDPLGGMNVTDGGFRRMTEALVQASETWSDGLLLSILEGGFSPQAVARAARVHVEELSVRHAASTGGGILIN